jgi:hypothetical protein
MNNTRLSSTPETVYVRPTRSIGGLVMDVTIEENHTDELEITEHPVEQGAAVTDHAYLKPASVTIKAGVSDSGAVSRGDKASVVMYEALRKLQASREPFDIVTGKRVYHNMLIKSLSVPDDSTTANALIFTAELQQVILVSVKAVTIPRARQRMRKTNATTDKGKVQAEEIKKSAALQAVGGTGHRRPT